MAQTNEGQNTETDDDYLKEAKTTHTSTTLGQGGRGRALGCTGGQGGRGASRDNIQCFCCGAMGHYASQCPETLEDAQGMLEDNAETGTNMLHHATMDDPMNDIKPTREPINKMTFASLELNEAEDHDTSFIFVQDVRNVQTQHSGHLPPVTEF